MRFRERPPPHLGGYSQNETLPLRHCLRRDADCGRCARGASATGIHTDDLVFMRARRQADGVIYSGQDDIRHMDERGLAGCLVPDLKTRGVQGGELQMHLAGSRAGCHGNRGLRRHRGARCRGDGVDDFSARRARSELRTTLNQGAADEATVLIVAFVQVALLLLKGLIAAHAVGLLVSQGGEQSLELRQRDVARDKLRGLAGRKRERAPQLCHCRHAVDGFHGRVVALWQADDELPALGIRRVGALHDRVHLHGGGVAGFVGEAQAGATRFLQAVLGDERGLLGLGVRDEPRDLLG